MNRIESLEAVKESSKVMVWTNVGDFGTYAEVSKGESERLIRLAGGGLAGYDADIRVRLVTEDGGDQVAYIN